MARGLTALTPLAADHEVRYSPDGRWLLDLYSRVDLGPVLELRRSADGSVARTVERTDLSRLLAAGWQAPLPFHTTGRDGRTEIWGVIHRPQQLDPQQRYRVVEDIYAGPQGSFVPKSFTTTTPSLTGMGFAVASIDGMGTNNRSRAFHDVAWRNLKDAGLPDRIAWHKAAAAQYPWYDIDGGVGVYGTSAGGQNALGRCCFIRSSMWRVWPIQGVTTTAWTRSGGTSSGWAGRSARGTPHRRTWRMPRACRGICCW